MKNRNLLLLLTMLIIATFALSACGGGATEAPVQEEPAAEEPAAEEPAAEEPAAEEPAAEVTGSVGIVLPTREEPRWIQDETRFKDAFADAGYEVEILFSEGDSAKERQNVENLITKGVQVIIICPHDATAAAAAAEAARAAGVKVISYDRLIRETEAVDYYVTFDSIAVGAAQAQYLVDNASGTGNPLYLYAGAASDNNAFLFFEGAWNVLQPKIADGTFYVVNSSEAVGLQDKATLTREEMAQIIGQVTTEWDFDTAKTLAESNLTAASADDKGDVFILAPNDGTARAIADAFAADADVSSYAVTGQDAEIASVQYIIDGKQSMTVLKDVRTLVADAISAAIAFLEGNTPPETNTYNNGVIDVPAAPSVVVTVDQGNVQAEIIDSGYWDASEFTGLEEMGMAEPEAEAPKPPAPEFIEFGASIPLTGPYGSLGNQVLPGYELAVAAINEAGGVYVEEYGVQVPIRLTYYDDESDPTKAVSRLETLYSEQNVTAYLGGAASGMHAATSAIAEKNQVPYCGVAFALYSIHQQGYKYLFSPFPKTPQQAKDTFEILNAKIPEGERPTKVAIFSYSDDWGKEQGGLWEQNAAEYGYEVVVYEERPVAPDNDWSDAILKAKAAGADMLLSLPIFPDGSGMFKTMAELGWTPKFALVIRAPEGVNWGESMGTIGDYVTIFPGWHHGAQFPGADELNAAYEAEYGRPADLLTGSAYSCVQLLADAIERAGTLDRAAVRDSMAASDMMTVMGPVTFNEDGTGNVWNPLIQWQNGQLELVWPEEHATAEFLYPAPPFDER